MDVGRAFIPGARPLLRIGTRRGAWLPPPACQVAEEASHPNAKCLGVPDSRIN
jgi:hypothetical protein